LAIARLPAWREVEMCWPITPRRRGRFPLTSASLESAFPFGFRRARRAIAAVGQVMVWPRLVELRAAGRVRAGSDMLAELGDGHRPGPVGEVLGARPYQPGDSLRRIHWRQTARHDRLIICECAAAHGGEVEIILETAADLHPLEDGERPTLETAVSAAASLAKALIASGTRVLLRLGPQEAVRADHAGGLPRILDALATVTPRPAGRWPAIEGASAARDRRAATPWIITTAAGLQSIARTGRESSGCRFLVIDGAGQITVLGQAASPTGSQRGVSSRGSLEAARPTPLADAWGELTRAY
jgi:uncharacterized protein (DUF58 family)